LARHIGTDFFCCAVVTILGLMAWPSVCPELYEAVRNPKAVIPSGFEARMFNHRPAALRLCVFFTAYQVKNMWDTLVWNDGPEFIMHHLLCMFVGYGAITHNVGE
jgi:hypothetical protein